MYRKGEMMFLFFHRSPRPHPSGFTLVEVLVASTVLCITIIAVVVLVRKGGDLQVTNDYRLKARAILNARLDTLYQQANYAIIKAPVDSSESVTIDVRPGDNPLDGRLYTTVTMENLNISTSIIPVKKVTLALAWDTFDNERDSIFMSKWITE